MPWVNIILKAGFSERCLFSYFHRWDQMRAGPADPAYVTWEVHSTLHVFQMRVRPPQVQHLTWWVSSPVSTYSVFLVIWSQISSTKYRWEWSGSCCSNAVFFCLWQVWLWARASVSRATQVRSVTGVRSDTQGSLCVSGATAAVRAALTRIPASCPVCVRYDMFGVTTGLALVIQSRSQCYSNTTTSNFISWVYQWYVFKMKLKKSL